MIIMTDRFISKAVRFLLLAVALAAFIFSIVSYNVYTIKADNARAEYFRQQEEDKAQGKPVFSGPYCYPDRHPGFLISIVFLVGATFFSLLFAQKCWASFLFTVFFTIVSLSRFIYWYFDTQKAMSYTENFVVEGVNRFFYNAGDFDLAVLLLVTTLFFWQISILLRMLVKSLQRNSELP